MGGGKQNDLFQHHAGRKPYTIKTASLLIANFRGTLACILLSYYLLKVQEDLGGGAQESSISFSFVSVCILIIPLEIQLPCTIVTVVYCLRFCFGQHSFHYQCLPILFSVWYFEEVRAIRVTTKLSTLTRFEEAHLLIIRRNIK